MSSAPPKWPHGARCAISFTMDNLGEAQDVYTGAWPADAPVGRHFSVRDSLPRMLALLERHGVRATFFAEAWSLAVYPQAVRALQQAGHEVAWHGYQHEPWAKLSAEAEEESFAKSFMAADKAGVAYKGFRPPGGSINDRTYEMLRQRKVEYVSPLGGFGIENGIVILPFEWKTVDAFYYMEGRFCDFRKDQGEQEGVLSPAQLKKGMLQKVNEAIASGGYASILFHPFLQTSDDKFAVMNDVLSEVSGNSDIWCAPCHEVAAWVAKNSEQMFHGR